MAMFEEIARMATAARPQMMPPSGRGGVGQPLKFKGTQGYGDLGGAFGGAIGAYLGSKFSPERKKMKAMEARAAYYGLDTKAQKWYTMDPRVQQELQNMQKDVPAGWLMDADKVFGDKAMEGMLAWAPIVEMGPQQEARAGLPVQKGRQEIAESQARESLMSKQAQSIFPELEKTLKQWETLMAPEQYRQLTEQIRIAIAQDQRAAAESASQIASQQVQRDVAQREVGIKEAMLPFEQRYTKAITDKAEMETTMGWAKLAQEGQNVEDPRMQQIFKVKSDKDKALLDEMGAPFTPFGDANDQFQFAFKNMMNTLAMVRSINQTLEPRVMQDTTTEPPKVFTAPPALFDPVALQHISEAFDRLYSAVYNAIEIDKVISAGDPRLIQVYQIAAQVYDDTYRGLSRPEVATEAIKGAYEQIDRHIKYKMLYLEYMAYLNMESMTPERREDLEAWLSSQQVIPKYAKEPGFLEKSIGTFGEMIDKLGRAGKKSPREMGRMQYQEGGR